MLSTKRRLPLEKPPAKRALTTTNGTQGLLPTRVALRLARKSRRQTLLQKPNRIGRTTKTIIKTINKIETEAGIVEVIERIWLPPGFERKQFCQRERNSNNLIGGNRQD